MWDFALVQSALELAACYPDLNPSDLLLRLRRQFPAEVCSQAVTQVVLRRRAAGKFSRAAQMWFTPEGLEQSSSEIVAVHHASRFADDVLVVDAGCGIGGDLIALAGRGPAAGVERDPLAVRFARLNTKVYGVSEDCWLLHADLLSLKLSRSPFLFLDPARRHGERRHSDPQQWHPSWQAVCELACSVKGALVKTSPVLNRSLIPAECQREYISIGGECRELLLAFGECRQGIPHSALLLPLGDRLVASGACLPPVSQPLQWLYDPDPAVVAAGLIPELAQLLDARPLHPRIAYLTASYFTKTPFARAYRVLEALTYSRRRLWERLRAIRAGAITVKKRGVNISPERLVHDWQPMGDRAVTVLLYRTDSCVSAVLADPCDP